MPDVSLDLSGLGIFPMCLNQERALVARLAAQQTPKEPPPSLIRFGLRVDGRLSIELLRGALRAIVDRHPALRCTFSENVMIARPDRATRLDTFKRTGILDPGLLVQTVHETAHPPIVELDWSGMDQPERDLALLESIRQEDLRRFADTEPHRMRLTRIRESADRALLVVTIDHNVCDGRSAAIVCRELVDHLSTPNEHDRPSKAEAKRLSFPEFAAWQRRQLGTRYFQSSLSFWRDQWARYAPFRIPLEDLPFCRPLQSPPDHTFATLRVHFEESETAVVKALASRARTTLFAIFLAAFACVLARYTSRSSVVIWSHLLNRVQPGTFDSVGFFINTHILGIDLPAEATRLGIIRHVAAVVTAALAHQELPPSYLWSALKCAPRFPDAMVLMDFRASPSQQATPASSGLTIRSVPLPDAVTPRLSGLGLYVSDNSTTLQMSAAYLRAAFSEAGIERLLHDVRETVLGFANDPDQPWQSKPHPARSPHPRMAEFVVLDSECIPVVDAR